MFIYFLSFTISVVMLLCTEVDRNHKYRNRLLVFFALLIPIFLAGMRRVGIGTDTRVYAYNLTQVAKNADSFLDYWNSYVFITNRYEAVSNYEIGYDLLVYFSTKLFGTVQGLFLLTHIIIVTLIYKGIKRLDLEMSVSLSTLAFFCLFYGTTLNIMRQWLAIAILFYGFRFIVNGQMKKYFITTIIAFCFHKSAIIGLVIWAIYEYFNSNGDNRKLNSPFKHLKGAEAYKLVLLMAFGIAGLFCISMIGDILEYLGISFFGSFLIRYVRVYLFGTVQISIAQIIRRLPIIILLIFSWKRMIKHTELAPFLYAMYILEILTSQLSSVFSQSGRISYYFSVFDIILYSIIVRSQSKKIRPVVLLLVVSYLLAIFYYENVYQGWSEIVPYLFYFQ